MKIADGVKVMSFIPGRVRLRVDLLKGAKTLAGQAQARLAEVPGIREVEANPVSGSLLVKYDSRRLAEQASVDALAAALDELFPTLDLSRFKQQLQKG
jgi:hypothetical protein